MAALVPRIRGFNLAVLVITPALGLYGLCTVPFNLATTIFSAIFYVFSMLGITAGYHRLYSHRAYSASVPIQLFLLLAGASAVQGSALWWCRSHRSHHRYTDTPLDPYNSHRGLLYTHIGWMVLKPAPSPGSSEENPGTGSRLDGKPGRSNDSDLRNDKLVMWQHVNYFPIAFFMGYFLPCLVAGWGWGDWRGGLYFAGMVRLTLVHHCTFCVNSLAHYLGTTPYDDKLSPRDHIITAIVTLGEGHHNFHHQFPTDYRNAIKWYQWDPTKWFIWTCSKLGLAYHLKTFPSNEIKKGELTMKMKQLKQEQDSLTWHKEVADLPVVTWEHFQDQAKERTLVLIAGFIHDCTAFAQNHPGGAMIVEKSSGKDMTAAFFGGIYSHSNAAHNLLSMMRVGVLEGGVETTHDAPPERVVANLRPEDINIDFRVPPARKLMIVEATKTQQDLQ
ncbi:delta-9 CoA desaturase [Punctularia strigosozonata HHB-11173 SS5]|uniref:Acyl-CoA desaturase n=1 Tax=Punctularia strigosozonata (strain HHB-11173) TaxID=741275 RepID=R7S2L1_PUNST|nr:delta-9 CoA desaturase [Punctularia strigosozonata HHB-11173 SS5]EIN03486.1 delta-9 CoA desaturase [Punctularia strigosozonata HHB-11173 SS5]